MKKVIYLWFGLLLLTPSKSLINAHATPPLYYPFGSYVSTIIKPNLNSPIRTVNADFDFYVLDEPKTSNLNLNENKNYLLSDYTLYNESDDPVTERFVFPMDKDSTYLDEDDYNIIQTQYKVTIDDKVIPTVNRYTFKEYTIEFDFERDFGRLSDSKKADPYFNENLTVVRYDISLTTDYKGYNYARVRLPIGYGGFAVGDQLNYYEKQSDYFELFFSVGANQPFYVYLIGDDVPNFANLVNLYENNYNGTTVPVSSKNIQRTVATFDDLITLYQPDNSDVSPVDYHNAMIDSLNFDFRIKEFEPRRFISSNLLNLNSRLLTWFEYEINFEARETNHHQITMPLFPTILTSYKEPVYDFQLLFSPSLYWVNDSSVTIDIHTQLYLISPSFHDFTKQGESHYHYQSDTWPTYDFSFELSTVENPQPLYGQGLKAIFEFIFWAFVVVSLVSYLGQALLATIIILIYKAQKKKH